MFYLSPLCLVTLLYQYNRSKRNQLGSTQIHYLTTFSSDPRRSWPLWPNSSEKRLKRGQGASPKRNGWNQTILSRKVSYWLAIGCTHKLLLDGTSNDTREKQAQGAIASSSSEHNNTNALEEDPHKLETGARPTQHDDLIAQTSDLIAETRALLAQNNGLRNRERDTDKQ